jgi:hypothetical protein
VPELLSSNISDWRNVSRALSVLLLATIAGSSAAFAQTRFYRASVEDIAGAPGTLIHQEPMSGAPLDAKSYRVLYRSTGLKGEPIAVSGVVVVPRGPAPPEGRPIVAWAHPTTGIVPHCAPSLAHFFFQQVQGVRDMVERGWIVAATDYPGLGTPGPHPYLLGVSEGRAVLDSLRAAKILAGKEAGKRAALWGHSQGGQAVLFAGLLASTYVLHPIVGGDSQLASVKEALRELEAAHKVRHGDDGYATIAARATVPSTSARPPRRSWAKFCPR